MKTLKPILLTIVLVILTTAQALATWSIIVIDPKTKEIGIAGASCTLSVFGIGLVVPGKGAIVVQAASNGLARMQGFNMLMAGASAKEVMNKIRQPDFDPENQQYAVISMGDIANPETYTGTKNTTYNGALTANGITVQGNTLANANELQAVLNAALKARKAGLPIQEILMLALEAGANAGGDKRCGDRKASSAFVIVAKPQDVDSYWLKLVVNQTNDTMHAVDTLRQKFNVWKEAHPAKAAR